MSSSGWDLSRWSRSLTCAGIRESASIFAVPTYLFLIGIGVMLAIGFIRNLLDGFSVAHPPAGANQMAGGARWRSSSSRY